jgi:hypothetical protein
MIQGEFKAAPPDMMAKIVTVVMVAAAGAVPFVPGMAMYTVVILPVILFITWLFSVTGFTIENNKLIVSRPLWQTTIVLPPDSVITAEPEVRFGLLRTFGNGGLFGYTGRFRNRKLGFFNAYATSWKHAVSIISPSEDFRIVVTPEDTGGFIQSVNG